MRIFRFTHMLLVPFLAMTEGGAMYQRLVNLPYWLDNMQEMRAFHYTGAYFAIFTPPVLIVWLIMAVTSLRYKGKGKVLLFANHILYLCIILATAFYFIPVLSKYTGNDETAISPADYHILKTWGTLSIIRQVAGFAVIGNYSYLLGLVNKKTSQIKTKTL